MSTEYMSSSKFNSALDFNLTGRLQLVSFSKEEQRQVRVLHVPSDR